MNFEPQLPNWGYELAQKKLDILIKYHSWLKETGIKTGLISQKNDQFIWDDRAHVGRCVGREAQRGCNNR